MTGPQVATVATVTPLAVRLKGALSSVPVAFRTVPLPSDLTAGQRVIIAVIDAKVTFLGRWEAV